MSEFPWLSTAMRDPLYHRPIERDPEWSNDSVATKSREANELGAALGPEYFPPRFKFSVKQPGNADQLGDMFIGGGFWIVSARCAAVLRKFDLGEGDLYPAEIFAHDTSTKLTDQFYTWNFGNARSFALPAQSQGVRPPVNGIWRLRATIADDELVLDRSALSGADVWIDPQFLNSLFFSGRLGSALREANLAGPFAALVKCRIN